MLKNAKNPFVDDIELPKTALKFRIWNDSFHQKILSSEIYLTSPASFNRFLFLIWSA
jgi:hypothetical protein